MNGLSPQQRVIAALQTRNLTLATAESCTGGWVGKLLTEVAGSSAVYKGGVIAYANEIKTALLDVSTAVLETQGAVCEDVALQMARGICHTLHTHCGIGITGIAGPGGGTAQKPVGLVFVAVHTPEKEICLKLLSQEPTRDGVRLEAALTVLSLLADTLEQ